MPLLIVLDVVLRDVRMVALAMDLAVVAGLRAQVGDVQVDFLGVHEWAVGVLLGNHVLGVLRRSLNIHNSNFLNLTFQKIL